MKESRSSGLIGRLTLIAVACGLVGSTSVAGAQRVESLQATPATLVSADSTHRRPRAIEYSDWYARRLMIHKIGSYTMLPMFAAEYYLGDKLLNGDGTDTEKNLHGVVAGGLGVLFTVNTVTGLWNLYDSRQDPAGRTRKLIHTALMLGADAGFAWAGAIGGDARESASTRRLHKNLAIGSMGLSTVGTAMMWFWKD